MSTVRSISVATVLVIGSAQAALAQPTQAQYDSLSARIARLEKTIENLEANAARAVVTPSAADAIAAVVDGDLVVTGRICIPRACLPNAPAQLQLAGQEGAEILFLSNLNGQDPQGAEAHAAMVSAGKDGGFRLLHNSYHRSDGDWLVWQESSKPRTVLGFDSQGTPSVSQDYDGVVYPSQSLILNFDRNLRTAWIQSMKAGWKVGFCTSPRLDNNCESSYWTVPTP